MAFSKTKKLTQKTVKAFEHDILLINKQAKKLGCTAAEIIHGMCQELRRKQYRNELGESFDLARADKKLFAEFQAEQQLWDATISDGLTDAT